MQIATDLHTLLQRGHVPGPYVLAGHSFGGLYVLAFAARYPDDVAGMVLVDSTTPAAAKQGAATPYDGRSYDVLGRVSALASVSARLGLARLFSQFSFGSLPPRSRDEVRATGATANNLRSTIDEYVQANASVQQAASLTDFADKPLVVLTAGVGSDATHAAAQTHLATLSTNSVHRVVDATHEGLVADEEHAAVTTQAILDVVASVRSAGPLRR
jgi:pimeloyl-ACP methyl ester carboxylesterase